MIKFDEIIISLTDKDKKLIMDCAKRAVKLAKKQGVKIDTLDMTMDLTAVQGGDTKLDLEKLLNADDFNFSHDVFGIRQHLNRNTGELEDCFLPRCSS